MMIGARIVVVAVLLMRAYTLTICRRSNDNNDYTPHPSFQSYLDLSMQTCVLCVDIYLCMCAHMLSRTLASRTSVRLSRARRRALDEQSNDEKAMAIEIQYLFDDLKCLLTSKLSLYAFWQ